jgi:hypothetical protein
MQLLAPIPICVSHRTFISHERKLSISDILSSETSKSPALPASLAVRKRPGMYIGSTGPYNGNNGARLQMLQLERDNLLKL